MSMLCFVLIFGFPHTFKRRDYQIRIDGTPLRQKVFPALLCARHSFPSGLQRSRTSGDVICKARTQNYTAMLPLVRNLIKGAI